MRPAFFISLLFFGGMLQSVELLDQYQQKENALALLSKKLTTTCSEEEKEDLQLQKASLLVSMQRFEDAFLTFLEAVSLKGVPQTSEEKEDPLIAKFLSLYLGSHMQAEEGGPLEQEFLNCDVNVCKTHLLQILRACCEANKGHFSSFFSLAYPAMKAHPDSPLTWKVRGMLYVKMFESGKEMEMRHLNQEKALECFLKAFEKMPEDLSLAIRILFFSSEQQRAERAKHIVEILKETDLHANWICRTHLQHVMMMLADWGYNEELEELVHLYERMFGYSRTVQALKRSGK